MDNQTASTSTTWTIGRLLEWTRTHFQSKKLDEPRLCAELLLAEALGCPKIDLYTRFGETPTDEQRASFREMVLAAAEHRPIAYLVGHKEFYSLDFSVTPDVLIPRPETELLVERASGWCEDHPQDHYDILDIGTGSGCISITLAKRNKAVHAVATDISAAALAVARQNAERHQVADRITFVQADFFNWPADLYPANSPPQTFDIIMSNPPYVAESDRHSLPKTVRDYEPSDALFSGEDGLTAYRRIAADIHSYLRPGGTLLLEIGDGQADTVTEIICCDAKLEPAGRHNDLSGTLRVLQFTLPA